MHEDGESKEETYDLSPIPAQPIVDASTPLEYESQRPVAAHRAFDVLEADPLKQLYLPIALFLAGSFLIYVELVSKDFGLSFDRAIWILGYSIIWNAIAMVAGLFVTAKLTGMAFGYWATATIRAIAIWTASYGVACLFFFFFFTNGVGGIMFGWLSSMVVYWVLFMWLFELDPQEAFIAAGVTMIARVASYLLYWIVLFRLLPAPLRI